MKCSIFPILLGTVLSLASAQIAYAERLTKLTVSLKGQNEPVQQLADVKPGDVVFEQKLTPTKSVLLPQRSEVFIRKTGDTRIEFKAGSELYLVTDKKENNLFCSYEPTFSATPKIGKPIELQACLLDSDGDGKFERVFTSEKGQLDIPPITHNLLVEHKKPFEPIVYEPLPKGSDLSVDVRISYARLKKDRIFFDLLLQSEDGEWLRFGRSESSLSKLSEPFTVFGVNMALREVQGEMLSIEVLSSMTSNQTLELSTKMIGSKRDVILMAIK